MRSFFSAILAIAAVVLATIAGPLLWAQVNVVDQNGFVNLAGPVGSDPQFQKALSAATAKTVSSQVQNIPIVNQLAQPLVEQAANAITSDPGFPAAWNETLRRSQELTVVDPEANANDSGVLNLDVAPLLKLAVDKAGEVIGQSANVPSQVLLKVGTQNQRNAVVQLADAAKMGVWLAVIAALVFVLALLCARRRSVVFIATGVGGLVLTAVWYGGNSLLKVAADRVHGTSDVQNLFETKFSELAQQSFNLWVIVALIISLVFLVGGIIGRASKRSRRIRA